VKNRYAHSCTMVHAHAYTHLMHLLSVFFLSCQFFHRRVNICSLSPLGRSPPSLSLSLSLHFSVSESACGSVGSLVDSGWWVDDYDRSCPRCATNQSSIAVQSDGTLTLVDLLGKNALEYVLGYSLRLLDARLEYDSFLAEESSERPRFYNIR